MLSGSTSREPGETLKCCTLVGSKRVTDAERQPVLGAAAPAGAAKRQRTQLLPAAAAAVLGESGTAYHKLVEFDRRVDVTLKQHRQGIEARLRGAGIGPNGEIVSAYPVCLRVDASAMPQPCRTSQWCAYQPPACRTQLGRRTARSGSRTAVSWHRSRAPPAGSRLVSWA